MKYALILVALCALLPSCSSTGGKTAYKFSDPRPKTRIYLEKGDTEWNSMEDVIDALDGKASVSGKTVDLRGAEINGSRLPHPKDRQDEKSVGVNIRIPGLTVRNGDIYNIPGGLKVFADGVTLKDLLVREIGEDAASNMKDRASGFRVVNCRFENHTENGGGDKTVQANNPEGFRLEDCTIANGITGVRIGESTGKGGTAYSRNNKFINVSTAHNVDAKTKVYSSGNSYTGVGKEWVVGPKASVVKQ